MDGLLEHIVAELSMQGENGAPADAILSLVQEYCKDNDIDQLVDHDYVAYLWSQLAQLPEVGVCVAADGKDNPRKVLKAPQSVVGPDNEECFDLASLTAIYGSRARLCVDEDTCLFSLTQSHHRPSKLTPMVYAILQYIASGRGDGKTTIEIKTHFKADPRSVYHYIKSLLELDLVVKLKIGAAGSLTNRMIHKRYLNVSKHWEAFNNANRIVAAVDQEGHESSKEDAEVEFEGANASPNALNFPPLDPLLLMANERVVKLRIIQLLKTKPDHCTLRKDLIYAINLQPVDKSRRRKLTALITEMIRERSIEQLLIPARKAATSQSILRLRDNDDDTNNEDSINEPSTSQLPQADKQAIQADSGLKGDETIILEDEKDLNEIIDDSDKRFKFTSPVHRQVLDVIIRAGAAGATHKELSMSLMGLAKRTIENSISDMETRLFPPHLSDFGIITIAENSGREKRLRQFSLRGYAERCKEDGLEFPPSILKPFDLQAAGKWEILKNVEIRPTIDEVDAVCRQRAKGKAVVKSSNNSQDGAVVPAKRGRPRKQNAPLADEGGKPKLGRPKKQPGDAKSPYVRKIPIKNKNPAKVKPKSKLRDVIALDVDGFELDGEEDELWDESEIEMTSDRGPRPKKQKTTEPISSAKAHGKEMADDSASIENLNPSSKRHASHDINEEDAEQPPKKKRGRPSKNSVSGDNMGGTQALEGSQPKRKRGRPRKNPIVEPAIDIDHTDDIEIEIETPDLHAEQPEDGESLSRTPRPPTEQTKSQQEMRSPTAPKPSEKLQPVPDFAGLVVRAPSTLPLSSAASIKPVSRSALNVSKPQKVSENQVVSQPQEASGAPYEVLSDNSTAERNVRSIMMDPHRKDEAEPPLVEAKPRGPPKGQKRHKLRAKPPLRSRSISARDIARDGEEIEIAQTDSAQHHKATADVSHRDIPAADNETSNAPAETPQHSRKRHSHTLHKLEIDLLSVIEANDGIFEDGQALARACHAFRSQRGPSGAHIHAIDSKTVERALENLENRNAIRRLTVSLPTTGGSLRKLRLVCLSSLPPDSAVLKEFLSSFKFNTSHISHGQRSDMERLSNGAIAVRQAGQSQQLPELLEVKDAAPQAARQNWRTVAQYFGYLVGTWTRVQRLHEVVYSLVSEQNDLNPFGLVKGTREGSDETLSLFGVDMLMHELVLEDWLKWVPVTDYSDDLDSFVKTNAQTKLPNIDNQFCEALKLEGRFHGKSRARITDLLMLMAAFGLVRAVREVSASDDLTDQVNAQDDRLIVDSKTDRRYAILQENAVPLETVVLWVFETSIPFYDFRPGNTVFPLVAHYSAHDDGIKSFWSDLWQMMDGSHQLPSHLDQPDHDPQSQNAWNGSHMLVNGLRQHAKWNSDYILIVEQRLWLQEKYHQLEGNLPIEDDSLQSWSKTILVPVPSIESYWLNLATRSTRQGGLVNRALVRSTGGQTTSSDRVSRAEQRQREGRRKITQKAKAAAKRKETEFDAILDRYCASVGQEITPGPGLDRLRSNYFSAAGMTEQALEEALRLICAVHASADSHNRKRQGGAPTIEAPQALILAEAEVIEAPEAVEGGRARRRWTNQENDLLRDFWVVMQARSQTLKGAAIPWKYCYEHVIKSHKANQLRMHFNNVLYQSENKPYFNTLVTAWKDIWAKARGAAELPEYDRGSMTGFDVMAHIRYLRATVFSAVAQMSLDGNGFGESTAPLIDLSAQPHLMYEQWVVKREAASAGSRWLAINGAPSSTVRTHGAYTIAATFNPSADLPEDSQVELSTGLVEAAIRSLVATPEEDYDADRAHATLAAMGDGALEQAIVQLRRRGCLVKILSEESRQLPGRNFAFAYEFDQAFNKYGNERLFTEFEQSSRDCLTADSVFPIVPEDAQMLALLTAVSGDHIALDFDITLNAHQRDPEDYASRKLDDELIESNILVVKGLDRRRAPLVPEIPRTEVQAGRHSPTVSDSLQDWSIVLNAASANGLSAADLERFVIGDDTLVRSVSRSVLENRVAGLVAPGPLQAAFWAGYTEPRLIGIQYAHDWAVVTDGCPAFVPRIWLNLEGNPIQSMFDRVRTFILSCVFAHPGCTLPQLARFAKPVLTTVELIDIVQACADAKLLILHRDSQAQRSLSRLDWLSYNVYIDHGTGWL